MRNARRGFTDSTAAGPSDQPARANKKVEVAALTMASDAPVAVVEGPKGKAEIYEVQGEDRSQVYNVKFNGQDHTFKSLGEAYIEAGEMAGTKT